MNLKFFLTNDNNDKKTKRQTDKQKIVPRLQKSLLFLLIAIVYLSVCRKSKDTKHTFYFYLINLTVKICLPSA